ncbi:EAL domain-containing protein [Phyllobacterium lublinensis]|uniref:EAL domain-containing protein n=1 Tax=Phyllobacterium lublinensis TaxID=2875708 RepID=UPI001CCC3AAB|nr:EAL domain-containing protein [Phyllobacterium sp. 2063]MBZ9654593.1 EAL domain-containing protein [Phyllobacterium sp. 2063]
MSRYIDRRWFLAIMTVVLITTGAACGMWISRLVVISGDRGPMQIFSDELLDRAVEVFAEADRMLAVANSSPYPFCSDKEIMFLRDTLFSTKYLKDMGRVKDGSFHCSAVFGNSKEPMPLIRHDLATPDGKLIYATARLAISKSTAPIIGIGNANVVLDPAAFETLKHPAYTFGVMYNPPDASSTIGMFGTLGIGKIDMKLPLGAGRTGDTVYRNVCRQLACVTVHADIGSLQASAQPLASLIATFGAALGGAAAVIMILLQRNNLSLKARLQHAVSQNRLTVEYQPIVDVASGRTVAAEALVRWRENGETIPPDVFIPVAEKAGFINRLTMCVIDQVLSDMSAALHANPGFHISINISAADLSDRHFGALLAMRLRRASVASNQIALEITERTTANASDAKEAIQRLRSRGHKIYIDDFGTGYSSLAYLGELNVDGIKIDKSFTQTIGTGSVSVSIVPQIIDMARVHGLEIVVEGIETPAQRDYFAALKPRVEGQGWLFGRPSGAFAIREALTEISPGFSVLPIPASVAQ